MQRKVCLETGEIYHVFSKSIAGFVIFNNEAEFERMLLTSAYYQYKNKLQPFSRYCEFIPKSQLDFSSFRREGCLVDIAAYCLMPTHVHFVLRQCQDEGISMFMRLVLNSYARYFNVKHARLGPLWATRFKAVLVDNEEYLYHLTRYVHLNPVTANLVRRPQDWKYSSYPEYIGLSGPGVILCQYADLIDMSESLYKDFVEDGIEYQKERAEAKHVFLE